MQGQKIALVTDKATSLEYEDLKTENGQLLVHLGEKGFSASSQIWDDENVNWSEFDAIVMNSPWDYKEKPEEFKAWLTKLEEIGSFILNPPVIMHWNLDKIYLKEMEGNGVKITPTLWFDKGAKLDVDGIFDKFKTDKIILKPRISANADHTFALSKAEAIEKKEYLERQLEENDFMVQPFLKEIEIQGEWSFIFFNGKFSHSVIKTPKANHTHEGTIQKIEAPTNLLETAEKIVKKFAKGCLYSRVDGLVIEGNFVLMRFKAIEPHLYLLYSDGRGMERYSQALADLLVEKVGKEN